MAFVVDSVALDADVVLTARIVEDTAVKGWRVTVLIDRPSGEPPIAPNAVRVELIDSLWRAVPAVSGPTTQWVEAGGAAGTTASAEFLFAPAPGAPRLLVVWWRGRIAKLGIRSQL